jgi:hypothetical protein
MPPSRVTIEPGLALPLRASLPLLALASVTTIAADAAFAWNNPRARILVATNVGRMGRPRERINHLQLTNDT